MVQFLKMGLKEKYEKLILNNAEAVAQVEQLLKVSLYLIPGRFRESELKSEIGIFKLNIHE